MKCAHKTSLPRHFLFKCVYQVIYVLGISNLPLSTILIFDFGTVPKVWYFPPFILFAVIFFSNFRYWYNYICISCVPRNMFSMCKMSLLVAPPPLPLFEVIFLNTKISSQVYVLLSWISCMQNVISERLPWTTLLSLFINPNVLRTQT